MEVKNDDGLITVDGQDTMPKLFRARVKERGDKVAMREKDMGIWKSYSWNDYDRYARDIAAGLIERGFGPGDVAAIQSETNKEWVFADMGILMAGGVVNGVYPTYQAPQLEYTLNDSDAVVLFVEDEEQLDKYLTIADNVPKIREVYVFDWTGLRGFSHPKVRALDELIGVGEAARHALPDAVDHRVDAGKNDDTAVLVYTSGTTGKPKGAVIPHNYLLLQMAMAPDPVPISDEDEILTYLPLCHVAERVISLCMSLGHGQVLSFAESSETVFQNITELSPTFLFAVPRIWEKLYSQVTTRVGEATWAGRKGYAWALRVGHKRGDHMIAGTQMPMGLRAQVALADALVFRNIKQMLGLDRAKFLLSGAAPISSDLIRWFMALGLPMTEAYGQTETGISTITRKGEFRPGSVGHPSPMTEIKLGAGDEILVRTPALFGGYLNKPEATAATLVDGWVHTGDVGVIDETGALRITDRLKDIIITAGGKNITPSQIENQLKFSPYISDAVVIGDKRKFLSCLVMIDRDNVETYAQNHNIPFTSYKSLCHNPEIIELIEREVARVNKGFSNVEQIKKFRLIDTLLDAEDEELTPTMKLKRSFVAQKYAPLINEMY